MDTSSKEFLSGNELIALAAGACGTGAAFSFPGPPATGILEAFLRRFPEAGGRWAVNGRVAMDLAAAAATAGRYALCALDRSGLVSSAAPLHQAALSGIPGALTVVAADDPSSRATLLPGDSRLLGLSAGVAVLDPSSPRDAHALALRAFELSARHGTPVLLRPVAAVCHGRHDFRPEGGYLHRPAPPRAGDPAFRPPLAGGARAGRERLLSVLGDVAREEYGNREVPGKHRLAVVASGHPHAILSDILARHPADADLLKIDMPHPLDAEWAGRLFAAYERILVAEEPSPLLELLLANRARVEGRGCGALPPTGELTFDVLSAALDRFLSRKTRSFAAPPLPPPPEERPPRLCPGCGHRAAFLAMRRAGRTAILSGEPGCVSLGVDASPTDTLRSPGSSILYAAALVDAHPEKGAIAAIGDGAFFQAGLDGLLDAVASRSPVVLCILDNGTSAMAGCTPPARPSAAVSIEGVSSALGVRFVRSADPYDVDAATDLVRDALEFARENGAPAVAILRHPCLVRSGAGRRPPPSVGAACRNCGLCYRTFGCPALSMDPELRRASVDPALCTGCGVCLAVCPFHAISRTGGEDDDA